jgi:hypothetical protein
VTIAMSARRMVVDPPCMAKTVYERAVKMSRRLGLGGNAVADRADNVQHITRPSPHR